MIHKLEAINEKDHFLVFLLGKKNHHEVRDCKLGKANTISYHGQKAALHRTRPGNTNSTTTKNSNDYRWTFCRKWNINVKHITRSADTSLSEKDTSQVWRFTSEIEAAGLPQRRPMWATWWDLVLQIQNGRVWRRSRKGDGGEMVRGRGEKRGRVIILLWDK